MFLRCVCAFVDFAFEKTFHFVHVRSYFRFSSVVLLTWERVVFSVYAVYCGVCVWVRLCVWVAVSLLFCLFACTHGHFIYYDIIN